RRGASPETRSRPTSAALRAARSSLCPHLNRDALAGRPLRGDGKDDPEDASLVRRRGALRVDVERERDLALKRAVLDLELLVMAAVRRSATLAGNHERARGRNQLDGVGLDAR